jgi:hypothetical protein
MNLFDRFLDFSSGVLRLRTNPIPKPTVYKIWLENDGKSMPPAYRKLLHKRKPRGSQVVFWASRQETDQLLETHRTRFPILTDLFWAPNTSPVMRSDILRLLVVYDRGGLYCDHDARWGKSQMPLDHDFVVFTEYVHTDEAVRKNMESTREHRGDSPEYNVRIGNYAFYSRRPHSQILARCLDRVQERMSLNAGAPLSAYGVLYSTGPDAMTDTLVEGLPTPDTLKPFEKCETSNTTWIDRDGESVLLLGRQPGRSILHHEIHGAWRSAHA